MTGAEILVFLLVAVAVLAGAARRHDVPYPIVLVLGGLGLGFVPWLPTPELGPDVVFFAFLPPLLYAAAFQASAYELRANALPISLLAVGLVLATMVAVAAVAHWSVGLPWAVAFVFGAVVSPTDPIAAAAVLGRLGAPARNRTSPRGRVAGRRRHGPGRVRARAGGRRYHHHGQRRGRRLRRQERRRDRHRARGRVAVRRLRAAGRDPSIDLVLSILTPFAAYVPAGSCTYPACSRW